MADKVNLFYAAIQEGKCLGVYSAKEGAPEGTELTEITAQCLEGSPESEKYICMAAGSWCATRSENGNISVEEIDIGPVWGCNAQSAIAGLFGQNFVRKGVSVLELYLYEINRDYAEKEIKNLRFTPPFGTLAASISDSCSISPECLTEDFIGDYLEEKRKQREQEEKRRSTKVSYTGSKIAALLEMEKYADLNTWQKPRCGRSSDVRRAAIENALMNSFSAEELVSLAEILKQCPDMSLSEIKLRLEEYDAEKVQLLERAVNTAKMAEKK